MRNGVAIVHAVLSILDELFHDSPAPHATAGTPDILSNQVQGDFAPKQGLQNLSLIQ